MRVLIVEDEALLAMMLEDMVREAGHEVVGVAADGAGAQGLARRERPDVVLMDINIRGEMDGVEAARRLRRLAPFRIIFITAYTDEANQARMQAVDPVAVLSKPYDARLLSETLARVAGDEG